MTLGLDIETFTLLHVALSLVGIATGFLAVGGMLAGQRLDGSTALFLASTLATSVTGFGFPADRLLPSHVVGGLSIAVLGLAIVARYAFQLAGPWRRVYVISAVASLYFNVFVSVVQTFQKVPALQALAPKGEEPPFAAAQAVVLLFFLVLGAAATRRFRSDAARP